MFVERQVYIYLHLAPVLVYTYTLYRIDKNSRLEIKAKQRRPPFGVREMRGISPSQTNSYYKERRRRRQRRRRLLDRLGFETGEKARSNVHGREKRSWIVFCFVQRVGGHHDDRIEHKRGAPEGVTGHKIPASAPSTLASRCRGLPRFSHIKPVPPLALACPNLPPSALPHQPLTVDPSFVLEFVPSIGPTDSIHQSYLDFQ